MIHYVILRTDNEFIPQTYFTEHLYCRSEGNEVEPINFGSEDTGGDMFLGPFKIDLLREFLERKGFKKSEFRPTVDELFCNMDFKLLTILNFDFQQNYKNRQEYIRRR